MRQLIALLLAVGLYVLVPPVYAAVVINEMVPKTDPSTWEWVELYNTGSESVSLDRWKLDHTAGDAKSFILNAGAIIEPHGFLTFYGNQTTISFGIDGDTVRLFDANGNIADSKSFPGTLGYNTPMGRSTDGGDGWVICAPDPYKATPNASNNCPPAPAPTATPMPTSTPTPTPKLTAATTPAPIPTVQSPPVDASPTPTQLTFGSLLPLPTATQVLGVTNPTPTPTPATTDVLQFKVSKSSIAYVLLGIAAAALSLMLVLWLRRRQIRRKL